MRKLKFFLLLLAVGLPGMMCGQGVYWSFNSDNQIPDFGTGHMAFNVLSVGAVGEGWGDGTLVGAVDSTPAGDAKDLLYLANVLVITQMDLSNLDFAGETGVTLTFAIRSDELFEVGEYLRVSYDIGSGYTGTQDLETPTSDWTLRTVTFGGALDNQADVKIRVESGVALNVAKVLEFDNVYAVPEPSLALPALMGGFLFFAHRAFRKKLKPPVEA